jgi:Ni/Fe-hydrogenase subunit HybB-like protein
MKQKRNIYGKEINLKLWWIFSLAAILLLLIGSMSVFAILKNGIGSLPLNGQIYWGVLICNFVFWIGIGHAGTFISAILLLLRQEWRTAINRFAEAMTIIAILLAALMPIIHLGKADQFFQLFPLLNSSGYFLLNFNSPLNWDFYAILTYLILSILFFYIGMLPDLGTIRNRNRKRKTIAFFAAGWTGSYEQWQNRKKTLYVMAGLATVLVIAVHSIVSFDFAVSLHIGWHSSIFPIYFVLGALLSGFAMLCLLAQLNKKINHLDAFIKNSHFDYMSQIMLGTSILLVFVYLNEVFMTLYSGNTFDTRLLMHRMIGSGKWIYFVSLILSLATPQLFWKKSIRNKPGHVVLISVFILIGMWIERYMIIVSSSEISFLPFHQTNYQLNMHAVGLILFGIGFFFLLFLLFIRFLPSLSMDELKKEVQK